MVKKVLKLEDISNAIIHLSNYELFELLRVIANEMESRYNND